MKLTENFSKSEFASKDGATMPTAVLNNVITLAKQLQVIRDYVCAPITINSGYRSPKHNKRVKGSPKSQHLLGKAADIVVKDLEPWQVHLAIDGLIEQGLIMEGGLSLYDTFVHYDIRGTRARW